MKLTITNNTVPLIIREDWWQGYYLVDQLADDGEFVTEVYHDDKDNIIQVCVSIADGYKFINRQLEALKNW